MDSEEWRKEGGGGRGGMRGREKGRKREGDETMGGKEKERILYSIQKEVSCTDLEVKNEGPD